MSSSIKYVHTNLIARDWKKLAEFYINVFECEPSYPERDLSGDWIDKLTAIKGARITGIHLKLPGFENGPTLEIFEYNPANVIEFTKLINIPGFSHLAFHVNDVEAVVNKVIENGGSKYGELVENEIPGQGIIKAVYLCDPEGNIIEVQNWKKAND
ncbi:MAG: VOC family protein [Bacteroidales bacterium]